MKKLVLPFLTSLAACALLSGCALTSQNKVMTATIVRATVATGALFGMEQEPACIPYLKAATPIICDAAGKSVLNPADVVAALQVADVDMLKTPIGVAVINAGLAIYESVYSAYGTNVQSSVMQPYLEGVCMGLEDALGGQTSLSKRNLPPHIKMRY